MKLELTKVGEFASSYIDNEKGHPVAIVFPAHTLPDGLTGEGIVRALNNHAELVAICEEFVAKVESGAARSHRTYGRMKAALALEVPQ
jgi:hypothetical protein